MESYYEEIERYFIQKRKRAANLAPIDWPVVKSWEERGIPLEVVFKGIDTAFARFQEKNNSEEDTIRLLEYCKYDVENCWQTYQEMVLGKPIQELSKSEFQYGEHEKLLNHLDHLIIQLSQSLERQEYQQISEAIKDALSALYVLHSQLKASFPGFDSTEIRHQLKDLEEGLVSAIEKTLSATQVAHLSTQVEQKLTRYKGEMTASVYTQTLRVLFRKELKILYAIPAFDLF